MLFVPAVFLMSTASAFGTTYLVAADNAPPAVKAAADYVCDGTDDEVEINNAISAAGTDDIVQLSQGNFKINNTGKPDTWILINQSNVTLQGNGPTGSTRTTLQDQQSGDSFIVVSDSKSNPSNITIKDFEINASGDNANAGIYVWGSTGRRPSYITIDNLVVKGGAGEALNDGIYAEYTDDMNITNCDIYDTSNTGIYVFRNTDTLIQYNYVENGGYLTDIRSLDSTGTQELDNEVLDTGPQAYRAITGIIICCGADCIMQYNTVNGAMHSICSGSYYATMNNSQLKDNTVSNASYSGIWFCGSWSGYDQTNCVIHNNSTTNNGEDGIHIGDSHEWPNDATIAGSVITNNIATNNGRYGIMFTEVGGGVITGSTVTGNDFRCNAMGATYGLDCDESLIFENNLLVGECPGITIDESDGSTDAAEQNTTTDTYTIVLDSVPDANVTVTVDPDVDTEVNDNGAGNSIDLTFTAGDWNTLQTVTVKAIDDAVEEGDHTSTITHTAASTDPNYDGISIDNVVVNITDNDVVELLTNPSFEDDTDPTSGGCAAWDYEEPSGWEFMLGGTNDGRQMNFFASGGSGDVATWMVGSDGLQQVITSETITNGETYTFKVIGGAFWTCAAQTGDVAEAKLYWTDTPGDPFAGSYQLLKTLTITQGSSEVWTTQSTTWTAGSGDAGKYLFVFADDGDSAATQILFDEISITYSCGCGDADLDSNGDVDLADFARLAGCWLLNYGGPCGTGDIDCNGTVGLEDLKIFSQSWLEPAVP